MGPIIGITADHHEKRLRVAIAYAHSVICAGGVPVILPPVLSQMDHFLAICDGFVFTGGDDPQMEQWGVPTHASAMPVAQDRQKFETALLLSLQERKSVPVFGVCLGMQWMGLVAGGTLKQDLQEPQASHHINGQHHISGELGEGLVHTHHHQALIDAGTLSVVANADDGVIEAVRDNSRAWYVGVQWHPERTENTLLGQDLFNQFVKAAQVRRTVSV
ncbi:MAG: gamma-glutamyl-gamma-aminobutyrate hydrolase family protein [Planctomycetes bacterium]|nr:gamma-glutamyl-gamma-aminobutyrate hydrolase family protein [Planctomycetota bacterium]